jgi:serine/threonine protein kinase
LHHLRADQILPCSEISLGGLHRTVSPTLSMRATQMGMILGTAAYMAPEQAKGKVVDRRADIWAFGVVLFEMLTGKHLFTGETAARSGCPGIIARHWRDLQYDETSWPKMIVGGQGWLTFRNGL